MDPGLFQALRNPLFFSSLSLEEGRNLLSDCLLDVAKGRLSIEGEAFARGILGRFWLAAFSTPFLEVEGLGMRVGLTHGDDELDAEELGRLTGVPVRTAAGFGGTGGRSSISVDEPP